MDGQGYGTMNEGDGKGAKRNRWVCLTAKSLEFGGFLLIILFLHTQGGGGTSSLLALGCRNGKVENFHALLLISLSSNCKMNQIS
jgi:hypothetical protein